MFTWSLGCAPSPARLAITSLAFMFDEVPEPVWKTSIGNWPSCSPSATSSPAAAIRSATSESSRPSSALVRAAAAFTRPSIRTTATGTRSPETGKLSTALLVSEPHSSCCTAIRLLRSLSGNLPARGRLAGGPGHAAAKRARAGVHRRQLLLDAALRARRHALGARLAAAQGAHEEAQLGRLLEPSGFRPPRPPPDRSPRPT